MSRLRECVCLVHVMKLLNAEVPSIGCKRRMIGMVYCCVLTVIYFPSNTNDVNTCVGYGFMNKLGIFVHGILGNLTLGTAELISFIRNQESGILYLQQTEQMKK